MHKSAVQLAEICGCAPTSYQAMCRRLGQMGIPYIPRPGLWPLVSNEVYAAVIAGQKGRVIAATVEPDFSALRAA